MDKIDTDIMEALLYANEPLSSVEIVKGLYCIETRQEMLRQVNKISYRLNKLVQDDFILADSDSEKNMRYAINPNKIKKGNATLVIDESTFELGDSCVILLDDNQILFLFDKIDL